MEWQPIETAPKDDHTLILGFFPDVHGEPLQSVMVWSETNWYGLSPSAGGYVDRKQPSHWMPLPSPPTVEE